MATALGNIAISNVAVGGSAATAIALGDVVVWQLGPEPAAGPWLCFTATHANSTLHLDKNGSPDAISLETSTDGTTWSDYSWTGSTGGTLTLANIGDKVYMRAKTENQTIGSSSSNYYKFVMTGQIAASGNIQTLLKADGSRTDAPAYCYTSMFQGCTSLTTTPALPATTLADYCYQQMFKFCSSLTAAPATLPATTLADYCCQGMFQNCSSLTTAPALPATTLASYCYSYMFQNCSFLTTAPALPATTLAGNCYQGMFQNCSSLTTAPSLPATTLTRSCYQGMFRDCSSLTTAPALPATTIAGNCYQYMFWGCLSLTTAPAILPATTLFSNCYNSMFYGCTALTTAPALPATTLILNSYYGMFQNCSKLASIDVSFTAWNPTGATTDWVSGVAASGTFTCPAELPDTRDESHIPEGWTVVRH